MHLIVWFLESHMPTCGSTFFICMYTMCIYVRFMCVTLEQSTVSTMMFIITDLDAKLPTLMDAKVSHWPWDASTPTTTTAGSSTPCTKTSASTTAGWCCCVWCCVWCCIVCLFPLIMSQGGMPYKLVKNLSSIFGYMYMESIFVFLFTWSDVMKYELLSH